MDNSENSLPADDSSSTTSSGLGLIFLIGFMGCGKTTLGRKLASRLGYMFMDLDHVLEAQVGMTIAEYFSKNGEDAFRKLESEVLKQTRYPENAVISTGGGLPCYFDNMQWMNAHGKTLAYGFGVFRDVPLKKLRTAVLIDRNHKKFPMTTDYAGMALSTVLKEHVDVVLDEEGEEDGVYLR